MPLVHPDPARPGAGAPARVRVVGARPSLVSFGGQPLLGQRQADGPCVANGLADELGPLVVRKERQVPSQSSESH